jgi:surface carbohydrate biosynthesis protein (TIGR04326 family)
LTVLGWRLRDIAAAFQLRDSGVWLWPLLRDDWYSSLSGATGLANCMSVALFDAALADLPRQRVGLYLFENHAWEKALLRAWRRHGHGFIVGVQHATTPFWFLPHSDVPSSLDPNRQCPIPRPDRVAVNGVAARTALLSTGFRAEMLVDVEAQRYLNLVEVAEQRRTDLPGGLGDASETQSAPRRILVLGEIAPVSTHRLLEMLEGAIAHLPPGYSFTFKPHPSCAARLANYPRLVAKETDQPLERILRDYAMVVTANSTSSAVDAYVAGLRVITVLDGGSLNLSPLRGQAGVYFVTTSEELGEALQAAGTVAGSQAREEFFFLDRRLPRWQRLLGSSTASGV